MTPLHLRIEAPRAEPVERDCVDGPLTIGRAAGADIVIADASMSRLHARLVREAEAWIIEDLGARNGTFVNGQRVERRCPLAAGDQIQLGDTIVRVSGGQQMPRASASPLGGSELGTSIFRQAAEITATADGHGAAPARVAARLKALNEFHRALAGPATLEQLLSLLLEQLFATLHPEEGVILLKEPDGSLRAAASRRLPGATGELVVSRRLVSEVVDKGSAALVSDLSIDERFSGAESMLGSGIRSILAAPIGDADSCLGMAAIYSRAGVRRFGEEDLELLVSLAAAAALRIRNIVLVEEAAARRVQDRELALAHEIQLAMLPRHVPERAEIDVAATLLPARAVGGDLYDFQLIDDHLWFTIADAAGKGVSAALYMAVTRTLFRGLVSHEATVADILERMNQELARDNDAQFFVTAFVGCLDLATGALTYSTAGHPPPLWQSAAGTSTLPLDPEIALGILPDASYRPTQATLSRGDRLLLYSDGVTEAIDTRGQLFGDARLLDVVHESTTESAQATVDRVIAALNDFSAGAVQEDDITLLVLHFHGRH
jgi:serine phosphatase RsbU (regulator of sigma subunit)/pSer/pThr/pTyr-binding forkhead associated (FHA) protein